MWGQSTSCQCTDQSQLTTQQTTKLLCYDKPKTNCCYYMIQGSAMRYIRGQGVRYVLTQPYIISHVLIPLPSAPTRPILVQFWSKACGVYVICKDDSGILKQLKYQSERCLWWSFTALWHSQKSWRLPDLSCPQLHTTHHHYPCHPGTGSGVKRSSGEMTWYHDISSVLQGSCDASQRVYSVAPQDRRTKIAQE